MSRTRHQRQLSAQEKCDLLLEISQRTRGTLDLVETLDLLLDAISTVVEYDAAGIFGLTEGLYPEGQRPLGVISGVARRGFPDHPVEEDDMLNLGRGIVGHAIDTGQTLLIPDVRVEPRYIPGREGTLSEIAVPITVDGVTIAALNLESNRVNAFDEDDLRRLDFFADAAALAIEKARLHSNLIERERMATELRIAREVQRSLLPQATPEIRGFTLAGLCLPSLELGGDCFDYLPLPDGRLGVVIADVAGKGVPASLTMATFRAFMRARHGTGSSACETVAAVDRLLQECRIQRAFVTCCYAILDPGSEHVTYAVCGHPPPLLQPASGPTRELEVGGPALGAFPESHFRQHTVALEPGDRILFYTDGLTEATSLTGEQFGLERVLETMQLTAGVPPESLLQALVEHVRTFTESPHLSDDLTLVALYREGGDDSSSS